MKNLGKVILFLILTTFYSCSHVDQTRYNEFAGAISKLSEQSEDAISTSEKISRENSIKKLATSPNAKLGEIFITVSGYDWEMDQKPLYLTLKKAKLQLISMNRTFQDYSNLLVELAGNEVKDTETFNKLAEELNKNSQKLTETIKVSSPKGGVAILSTAATGAFNSYINSKRKEYLNEAIKKNQVSVQQFSVSCADMVEVLRSLTVKVYNESFGRVSKDWNSSTNKTGLSRDVYDLNDSYILNLGILEKLKESYMSIPVAHNELKDGSENKSFKNRIKEITRSVDDLTKMHKKLTSKEGKQ